MFCRAVNFVLDICELSSILLSMALKKKLKRGRKPKQVGTRVRDWYSTMARLRPDIAAAVRADSSISVNAAINDSLARRYNLPPYVAQ